MSGRPPRAVLVAIAAATVVGMEVLAVAAWCVPFLADGEAWLRAIVTLAMCIGVATGIASFIHGALRRRADARAAAVGWSMPIAASLGLFGTLFGLLAILLEARAAAAPLAAFFATVIFPTGTIGVALLRPSARAWFETGPRRARRPPGP